MSVEFLNPTHEAGGADFRSAARLPTLTGTTVAIISNGKRSTKPFFDAMALELRDVYGVADVVRITKSNYSAPVEPVLLNDAQKWQAIISGIGD